VPWNKTGNVQGPPGADGAVGPQGATDWADITSTPVFVEASDLPTYLDGKQDKAEKGLAGGYASLDGAGKVPIGQLPASIMEYQGVWNAATNTPALANGAGDVGDVYRVSVGGTRFGATLIVGDYIIYNGATWEKSATTDAVASVAGLKGDVTAAALRTAASLVTGSNNGTATQLILWTGTAAQYAAIGVKSPVTIYVVD